MKTQWMHQTLALAGIFQAAALVEELAKTGFVPSRYQQTSIASLFKINPDSTLEVYGGDASGLELGLQVMLNVLRQKQVRQHPDALRYVLGMLHLQKKMMGRKDMLGVISKRLQQISEQADHFGCCHENVLASIGGLYGDTISTFRFRIQVMGDFNYLQQARIANQVRALLFAGIRSATLWRQVKGSRLQLLIQRKRLAACAEELLRTLPLN
ncbi:high frequency lysogenization protein HflD [Pseudomaricurvus sp. HS19]|uniref:high frequency lysogenization protein HflD n=1 Tax=Pseudomaricurvus sp. HS19 TaxID=2692626 RepID=UPI001F33A539|nr:high frequency lysogenization protein HflD [Pseudomaricurvus sp. HS19]